ncbi:MAG TPA: phosphonate ABC transporter ATP-binding protein, partial [Clostridium sp.]|nr:phosphonate ABC transporter ATP-binding protein [Clostridium sp.]
MKCEINNTHRLRRRRKRITFAAPPHSILGNEENMIEFNQVGKKYPNGFHALKD